MLEGLNKPNWTIWTILKSRINKVYLQICENGRGRQNIYLKNSTRCGLGWRPIALFNGNSKRKIRFYNNSWNTFWSWSQYLPKVRAIKWWIEIQSKSFHGSKRQLLFLSLNFFRSKEGILEAWYGSSDMKKNNNSSVYSIWFIRHWDIFDYLRKKIILTEIPSALANFSTESCDHRSLVMLLKAGYTGYEKGQSVYSISFIPKF